jgi:hypothetical protein
MRGRSIRIFLVDGTPGGLRTAEVGLSTIKAVSCPRTDLESLGRRTEARKTGVYILAGDDLEHVARLRIYVGEGDEVFTRIKTHNNDESMDFWDRVLLFVSKDENLTKAHVRYIERRLLERARVANRCSLANRKDAIGGPLPEADVTDMEEFLEQIQLLAAILGLPAFEGPGDQVIGKDQKQVEVTKEELKLFYIGPGFDARCTLIGSEFVVHQGSHARLNETDSLPDYGRAMRKTLIDAGVLRREGDAYIFTQDYPFPSPTSAAQVVGGSVVNGRAVWKLADGHSYKEWQATQVEAETPTEQRDVS